MSKSALYLAILLMFISAVPASAGVLGPANPENGKGFSLGTGLFFTRGEYEGKFKFDQLQGFGQINVGFSDNFGFYLRGGASDLDIQDAFLDGKFEDGYRPFGTLGVKALLYNPKPIGLGFVLEGTYFMDHRDQGTRGDNPFSQIIFRNEYEINGAIVIQTVIEGGTLYGGPLFYYRKSDLLIDGFKDSIEEASNFGGLIGVSWPLMKGGLTFDLEAQFKTKISYGGSVNFSF